MLRITGIVLACLFFIAPAEARHRHGHNHHPHRVHIAQKQNNNPFSGAISIHVRMHRERHAEAPALPSWASFAGIQRATETILPHPAGCPARAFCGCGAAVRVFGRPVRELWLAANWFRFPRALPAPGMVAVRRHHVMVLEADLGGGRWRVWDANSGRGLTRVHVRSLAGYAIVRPTG
jgi:hypothetical protein